MIDRGIPGAIRPAALQKRLLILLVSAVLAGGLLAGCSSADGGDGDGDGDGDNTGGSSGFTGGAVTAAHPLAAEAGAKILEDGGNAIDAAVVTQFVLNVVEPTSSGIGGGSFMGIYLAAEDRAFFIDSREKAPAAATPRARLTLWASRSLSPRSL